MKDVKEVFVSCDELNYQWIELDFVLANDVYEITLGLPEGTGESWNE